MTTSTATPQLVLSDINMLPIIVGCFEKSDYDGLDRQLLIAAKLITTLGFMNQRYYTLDSDQQKVLSNARGAFVAAMDSARNQRRIADKSDNIELYTLGDIVQAVAAEPHNYVLLFDAINALRDRIDYRFAPVMAKFAGMLLREHFNEVKRTYGIPVNN
jgi:hypothetical protein